MRRGEEAEREKGGPAWRERLDAVLRSLEGRFTPRQSRLLRAGALVAFLAVYALCARHGQVLWSGAQDPTKFYTLLGTCLLLWTCLEFSVAPRSYLWMAASLGAVSLRAGRLAGFVVVGVLLFVGISRLPWRKSFRLLASAALWGGAVWVWRHSWHSVPRPIVVSVGLFWASLPFGQLYLVSERSRGFLKDTSVIDEVHYLCALPRWFLPFPQGISPRRFLTEVSEATPSVALSLSGLALGLFSLLLHLVRTKLPLARLGMEQSFPGHNVLVVYATNACGIFSAMALVRLLGVGLDSGFRYPFLATSIGDFFSRFNSYVYEEIRTLLFTPFFRGMSRLMPAGVAYVLSGYAAIFLGVYVNSFLLTPLCVQEVGVSSLFDLKIASCFAAFWTFILLPRVVPFSLPQFRGSVWVRRAVVLLTIYVLGELVRSSGGLII